jgi:long-subunit fatty acid transport protein
VTALVQEELKDVVNWGVGIEKNFTPDLAGYASYHTDRSARPADSPPDASVTAWDLNHVTGGITFNAWRSNFAVGGSAAFGNRPIPGSDIRPDRVPPAELKSNALILTGTIGWKISF